MIPNPAFNLQAFDGPPTSTEPPALNAVYLRDGKFDGMTREDVASSFTAFRAAGSPSRLSLFFHGGLVDKSSGQQGAAREYDLYKDIAFPLFFIWESGFFEVLSHHLPLIFAETIFGRVVAHANDLILGKLHATQAAPAQEQIAMFSTRANETPEKLDEIAVSTAELDAFMTAIKNDPLVQNEAVAIAKNSTNIESLMSSPAKRALQLSPRTFLSPEIVSSLRGAYAQANSRNAGKVTNLDALPLSIGGALEAAWAIAKAAVPVIVNCVRRFASHRDHGVTCTIVEEVLRALYLANFGSSTWEEMKRETEDSFGTDSSVYGGTAVIEEVCQLLKDKPSTPITLVGHSTGAVYIGNFLRHIDVALLAQGDTTSAFDVILMAPANTDDFYAKNYGKRVQGIRIFQMSDTTEQQDHLMSKDCGPNDPSILGKVYPRSLLYLVSGICESFDAQGATNSLDADDMPILGMDRYFAEIATFSGVNYQSVCDLRNKFVIGPPAFPSKFVRVLSPTPAKPNDGFRSTSEKHGNFPGDKPTIASIRVCFQQGL